MSVKKRYATFVPRLINNKKGYVRPATYLILATVIIGAIVTLYIFDMTNETEQRPAAVEGRQSQQNAQSIEGIFLGMRPNALFLDKDGETLRVPFDLSKKRISCV